MSLIDLKTKLKINFRFYLLLFLTGSLIYWAVLLANHLSVAYLWLLGPAAVCGVLSYLEHRRLERRKLVAKLRREWGIKELRRQRNFAEIAGLFEQAHQSDGAIDDRTWHDLNLDLVFSQLDRTFTWPGSQWLYQLLRSPEIDDMAKTQTRARIISVFQNNAKQREDVQIILSSMDTRIGSGLCSLIWDTPDVQRIHPRWLYGVMFLLALLSPFLLLLGVRYFITIILVFQVNMYLHFRVQKAVKSHFEGVRSLGQLIRVSRKLAVLKGEGYGELQAKIRSSLAEVNQFTRIVRFVGVETTDPFAAMFQQYFTIFLLAEVRGFYKALDFVRDHRMALQELFEAVGELDAMQAVASYRSSLAYYCEPVFINESRLTLEEAYHPLLSEPVSNSIEVRDRGILITGSNMSGKSTFLRTVGLNVLLAQTIATCTSQSYQACPLRLLTSIGRSDNVVEGKSYYLEEALSVLRILEAINDRITTLVIFDELYRGTNSEERIFAARRVMEFLARRNAFVFMATHDLELTDLLADSYASMHFSERVGELGLEFDYKLKEGPATTKNAIALLRYLGYPGEITDQS